MPQGSGQTSRSNEATCTRTAGFTLIELLVVLVLASLLAVLVAPSVRFGRSGAEMEAAAGDIRDALRRARLDAITGQAESWVTFDLGNRRYSRAGAKAKDIPAGLDIQLVTAVGELQAADVARIAFLPSGASTGGRVLIFDGEHSVTVVVDWLTGRVSLSE